MQHKWMVLLTALVLVSGLLAPAGVAPARAQGTPPHCPPYEPGMLRETELFDSLPLECLKAYKAEARNVPPPAADVLTLAIGGPDDFGYYYNNGLPFHWINAATNSGLTGDDNASGPVNIGFPFLFYGVRYTQLYFNTNGLITFGAGTSKWGAYPIPTDLAPNNYIAPFWDDLLVGSPYNGGGIYTSQGGVAPNRYFVVEWRNVENYDGVGTFSFEAILYEKGDIVILHKSLPSEYFTTVGIEDISGDDGIEYRYANGGLSAPKAIRFFYPTEITARVTAYPWQQGGLVPLNGRKDFQIHVVNPGTLGADTYDLTHASAWPVTFYAANGTTPLSDTDGDTVIDTGLLPAGGSTTVIARYRAPVGTVVGDRNFEEIQLTSSRNTSVTAPVRLYMSVPAAFANVFVNNADSAMSFFTASASGTKISKATPNNYFGYSAAMAPLTTGNYFYAWSRGSSSPGGRWAGNIEYVILNRQGAIVRAPGKLTDNSGATLYTWDSEPAIAAAPNGTVGVVWRRYLYNEDTDKYNFNIFFATLNAAGVPLTGPTNLTNTTTWAYWSDGRLGNPGIAASSDNRFVISWDKGRKVNYEIKQDIWYAVRNTAGAQVFAPKALTSNGESYTPVLNSLASGKVIISWMWHWGGGPYYAVINSGGSIFKPASSLQADTNYFSTDAVQLPNGNVAVAWSTDTGVQFVILNSAYQVMSGPTEAVSPSLTLGVGLSLTTDASGHVIMTWVDSDNYNKLLYALGNSTGTFLTEPMFYHKSGDYFDVSWHGQGNAPYQADSVISGNAGVGGATLTYPGGSTKANSTGKYSFKVPPGWSGTVTPSRNGYVFSPANRTYTNVRSDKAAQNYTATPPSYSISGNTGLEGVTLSYLDGTPRNVISQADGSYSLPVSPGWSGTVTPSRSGYTFAPASRTYSNVLANKITQNYAATTLYSVSGNTGVSGVTLSYTDGTDKTVLSQTNGNYSLFVPENWSGTVTPTHTCFTFDPVDLSYTNLTGDQTAQDYTPTITAGCADVSVEIGGAPQGRFGVPPRGGTGGNIAGVDNGPVKIESTNAVPMLGAERLIYKVNGTPTSFSEMMALPNGQLDTIYYLPWYNSKTLDTELHFANPGGTDATVRVTIGPVGMEPFTLLAGTSLRKTYAGIDSGPVKIVSDVNIVAAERVIYKAAGGVATSFTEMMALPNKHLEKVYWLPWYNNKTLDTQLRFANVSGTRATVTVTIAGNPVPGGTFTLDPGASVRKSFTGIDAGPVRIESDVNIVAAERILYNAAGGVGVSFSEMMAFPNNQVDTTYWLPWYNSKTLDTQLRFANLSDTEADIRVTIGGQDMGTFALPAGTSLRKSYTGTDSGPVKIETDGTIAVSERVIYHINNVPASFSEIMAIPNSFLDTLYWLPWYNNNTLDTQLRFGMP